MPEKELGKYPRLDRTLGRFLFAFLVEGIALGIGLGRILRVHGRHKSDPFAVGRPDAGTCVAGDARQLPGFAATYVDYPELIFARAIRFKKNLLAIGTPARVAVVLG